MLRLPARLELGPYTIHLDVLLARLHRRRRRVRRIIVAFVTLMALLVAAWVAAPQVRGHGVVLLPVHPADVQLTLDGQPVGSGALAVPSGSHTLVAERPGAFPASQVILVTRGQTVTLELPPLRPLPVIQRLPLPTQQSTWSQVSADAGGGWRLLALRPPTETNAGLRPGWGPQPTTPPLVLHLDRQGLTRLSVLESYPVADEIITAEGARFWALWSEPSGPKLPGVAGMLTVTTPAETELISTTGTLRGLWWAPGGRALLAALPHDQGQDLAVIDPRRPTATLEPLITVPGTVKSVHWHPGGRAAVIVTAIDSPTLTSPQVAPRPDPTQTATPPETAALAYNAVLVLLPADGTAQATRLRVPPVRAAGLIPLTWTDDALWWVTDTGLGLALDRVDLASGASERRGTLPSGLVALTVLADGDTVRLVCGLPDGTLRVERWPEGDALFPLPGIQGQGLLAEDWDRDAATPPRPAVVPAPFTPPENTPPALPQILPGLIVPAGVALMLDTALAGDTTPAGTPGRDGRPRSKNLTTLIGTVRVFGAQRGGPRRVTTRLGAVEYRYELQINEVVGDDTAAARSSYSLPISMSDTVRARYEHLLVDGQRLALLGPLGMEEFYDQRYQRDAYDAGRRTWDIRIDVLGIQEVGGEIPDAAWVQLEGEVVDRPRIYSRQYGERRDLAERYAGVTLRYREVLAGPYGMAVRPVVKSIPVEVLITPDEELIPASDALLRPGNKVRIEGRLSPATFRLPRRDVESEVVQTALSRAREDLVARNTALERQQAEARAQHQARGERGVSRGSNSQTPRQAPLSTEALERRIARVQQSLLTGRRVRVEVGYVELLHGEAATPEERMRLIAESEVRQRPAGLSRPREMAATELPGAEEIAGAIDDDVGQAMAAQAASADVPDDAPERSRPRRRLASRSGESSGTGEEPVVL